jgi:hypothetical protein
LTDATSEARRWLAALRTDPTLHLHNFDLDSRTAVLVRLDQAAVDAASFLDDRALPAGAQGLVVPLDAALEAIGAIEARPHDAIFHVARCGSTLVSRLVGALPANQQKREPLAWLACGVWARFVGPKVTERAYAALFEGTSRALARPFRDGDRVVVKSTSVAANLATRLLDREPSQKAVALTLPLERWLAAVIGDESSRDNVHHYAAYWLGDLDIKRPDAGLRERPLSLGERLAAAWCAPMLWFAEAQRHAPERVKVCDVDRLLEHPAVGVAALNAFLELGADSARIEAVARGPLLERYSKDPAEPFDREAREARIASARAQHAEEIAAGMAFAERFAAEPLIAEHLR